jgi:hypothetical protein
MKGIIKNFKHITMILKNFEIHQLQYRSFIKVLRPSKKEYPSQETVPLTMLIVTKVDVHFG